EVLRTKYDYIFKLKVLEIYFESLYIKNNDMNKKTLKIVIAVVALILLLVIGKKAGWFGSTGNFKEVEVAKVEPITIIETVAATGKIQPETEVKISSEVSGEIIELAIVEGQQVKKGDLLIKINPDLYQSGLQRSLATLQNIRDRKSVV